MKNKIKEKKKNKIIKSTLKRYRHVPFHRMHLDLVSPDPERVNPETALRSSEAKRMATRHLLPLPFVYKTLPCFRSKSTATATATALRRPLRSFSSSSPMASSPPPKKVHCSASCLSISSS